MGKKYNANCLSSYLSFRFIFDRSQSWNGNLYSYYPEDIETELVYNAKDILKAIKRDIAQSIRKNSNIGVLLSGGIDSAIMAALLPRGTSVYTVKFEADKAVDESIIANTYAKYYGHKHIVVNVSWKDYQSNMDNLMWHKKAPLHPAEVGLYLAAKQAKEDGIETLATGLGADIEFGGLDGFLANDLNFQECIERHTFVNPELVLKNPVDLTYMFEQYRVGASNIDNDAVLQDLFGLGTLLFFSNALNAAGVEILSPFESLSLAIELDLKRIRSGDSKYLIKEVFHMLYRDIKPPDKIAFARPMDEWLNDWDGPVRSEFIDNIDLSSFTGDQKWNIFCLERFLNMLDNKLHKD